MVQKKKKSVKKNSENVLINLAVAIILFILSLSSVIFKSSMGILGEYLSKGIFIVFGYAAYLFPFVSIYLFFAIRNDEYWHKYKVKIFTTLMLITVVFILVSIRYTEGITFNQRIGNSYNQALNYSGVGVVYTTLYTILNFLMADVGIYIFSAVAFFISYFILFEKSLSVFFISLRDAIGSNLSVRRQRKKSKERFSVHGKKVEFDASMDSFEYDYDKTDIIDAQDSFEYNINFHDDLLENDEMSIRNESKKEIEDSYAKDLEIDLNDLDYQYVKPTVELLNPPVSSVNEGREVISKNAKIIVDTLRSFGIESEVVNINSGPTVTSYEVKPQSGIKVSKIVNLSNDLSLSLASSGVRIEAPIPGKPYVGIEVPNVNKDIVSFRELLFTDEFQKENNNITVALGKNIFGKPIYANLNEMPHLLIAGATGAGKSVLVNIIIMSIIYKYSPKDVQFIMIDPKMVELNVYNGIPHLSNRKVITDAARATNALKYAVDEMVERFEKFSKIGCRDIGSYNNIAKERGISKMPYFVVIIDELSDLMMEASKDVESYITRLAQMGRASGVHLLIATQRPSVDVITGVIKANIPSRISFQVSSQIDSRTILDMSGAEKLLGKGDMLYYPAKYPKPVRVQGAFISDREVESVVNFVKNQNVVKSDNNFNEAVAINTNRNESLEDADELLNDAIEFVIRENQASISAVQRRFRVGYARAGRMIDQMEKMGIIGEHDGSKPRKILKDISYLEKSKEEDDEFIKDEFTE